MVPNVVNPDPGTPDTMNKGMAPGPCLNIVFPGTVILI